MSNALKKIMITGWALVALGVSASPAFARSAQCDSILGVHAAHLARPKVIVLGAPSGGGKTTLMEKLIHEFPGEYAQVIETTTRAPRGQEVNGKDYNFVSKEEFESQMKSDGFVAWTHSKMNGQYYGTARATVQSIIDRGQTAIVLTNPENFAHFEKDFPNQVTTFYILPPSLEVLEARLRARQTDTEQAIQGRLAVARQELADPPKAHVHLVNDDLERAYTKFKEKIGRHVGADTKLSPLASWRSTPSADDKKSYMSLTQPNQSGGFSKTDAAREQSLKEHALQVVDYVWTQDGDAEYMMLAPEAGIKVHMDQEAGAYLSNVIEQMSVSGVGPDGILRATMLLPVSGRYGNATTMKWALTDTYDIMIGDANGMNRRPLLKKIPSLMINTLQEIEIPLVKNDVVTLYYERSGSAGSGGFREGRITRIKWDGK